ncbi:MAG: di-heme oxidoredictase family protein, partial [Myxococcota bacterium]|nr:di-heme oxidoredictase family protein [Myxococcota bacterium]
PPEDGRGPLSGLLLRVSRDSPSGPEPDPVLGFQIQDLGLPGVPAEFVPRISRELLEGAFPDGAPFVLEAPTYHLEAAGYGPADPALLISPRIAVQVIGLALLEAVPQSRLEELADPEDRDGDGISGRIPWTTSMVDGAPVVGRLGWKGQSAGVVDQTAKALAEDIGLTSSVEPWDGCMASQEACLDQPNGGEPEVSDAIFERIVLYTRALAVPARRAADDPDVRDGKVLFSQLGCAGCHVPRHETGPFAPLPELAGQEIYPYTDLLLHDMGPGLADGRPSASASGSEWQTRPLWGIGLLEAVNGHTRLLHDGRADGVEEAVLWHGGEAEGPKAAFMALSRRERSQLVAFVEDL